MDIVTMTGSSDKTLTMSSREISELTGKRHDNVVRDIEKMLTELGASRLIFEGTYLDQQDKPRPCFNLPPREVKILITGYDVVRRAKVIDRLEFLEHKTTLPALTGAKLLAAIAAQAAEQEERVGALESKVKLIEATMPREQDYFTVIGWARYIGITVSNSEALGLGRKCAKYSRERNVSIGDTTDPRYGLVHTYHADICDAAFCDYFDAKAA